MRHLRYLLFLLVLVGGWGWAQAEAATSPPPPGRESVPPEYRQRWEQLSPQERQRLLQQYQRWQDLPAAQRQELSERHRQLEALAPAEQAAVRRRFEAWQRLSPAERSRMQSRLKYWRRLSPAEKEPVLRALSVLKRLLPEEFEAFKQAEGPRREELRLRLARRLAALLKQPMDELHRLGELPPEARQKAVEKLLTTPTGGDVPPRPSGATSTEPAPSYSTGK